MADEHPQIGSDDSNAEECETPELRGVLSKWTNYIHGWQDRFIVLRDGTLSYYKSQQESNFGCRGALSLLKATVKPHEFDECRFDVSVNDCVWYLRATTPEEKQQWLDVLDSFKGESGYGTGSDSGAGAGAGEEGVGALAGSGLQRHDSAASLHSCSSGGRATRAVADKIAELDTYAQLLIRQADLLQRYFDICETQQPDVIHITDDTADPIDAVKMLEASPAAVVASEVRASAGAFRDTCVATQSLLQQCVELLSRRERFLATRTHHASKRAKDAEEMCSALSEQLQEARIASYPGPDFEEGPHSTLPEDEFYDAVETGLDKMEEERCSRLAPAAVSAPVTRDHLDLPSPRVDATLFKHMLYPEIERITTEQLQQAFEGVGGEAGWQLFAEEGDMRMYRREVEIDGMVVDPLKAMHIVRGVTGRELCHYFFNPRYRHDWEATLETMTIVEPISSDTLMFHQSFKRVWPASQRDAVFWSHVRAAPENKWTVVNHSMHHPDYPANASKCIRVSLTVCLACHTEVTPPAPGTAPRREDVTTNIAYCSTVNPGGWAPASVLRAVYKREYPKFLKRFTHYVADQCQGKPLAL